MNGHRIKNFSAFPSLQSVTFKIAKHCASLRLFLDVRHWAEVKAGALFKRLLF
jgi:hypothetical protein